MKFFLLKKRAVGLLLLIDVRLGVVTRTALGSRFCITLQVHVTPDIRYTLILYSGVCL